ncbi:HlyD family type I secretion periplasmic adaptor subunit [Sulfitobacter sp. SK011]|uniref:HlyD family type I secretion periplasmic adaptor subunit n=1 Tax=Sulfitobacter sp. SK011 TaxID=1389004 RepID=UPI000E0C5C61|nr:HlyD family type I secretion periplasmic adaptor subunit [Sulfitobacter sp. SK011]AXI43936.1 HlyD family type I secretion periplasmic adaptor subunit [Sulfitobacter sp. SK011]
MRPAEIKSAWRARLPLAIGYVTLALLIGMVWVWGIQSRIAGAVVSSGVIEVETHRQVIQHPTGGVVGEILTRDGDRIEAGDVLIRLDDKLIRSELTVIENQLLEAMAHKARLVAERDGTDTITLPDDLQQLAAKTPDSASQIEGQQRLFEERSAALVTEKQLIAEQIAQIRNQITGTEAQLEALSEQNNLLSEELGNAQNLLNKKLVESSRVSRLKSETAGLTGQVGQLQAQVAQLNGEIAKLMIEKLKLQNQRREEAVENLRELAPQEVELAERRFSKLETLSRMDIRSPVSGIVYGSTVFALKSVIQPAEPIMYVIPMEHKLIVSARIDAASIDQVRVGQDVSLRFSAFNQRSTPEVRGHVTTVSADVFTDDATGKDYYEAIVAPEQDDLKTLGNKDIVPGMPVQVFVQTEERTPLSYLTKPLTDYFTKAFRES